MAGLVSAGLAFSVDSAAATVTGEVGLVSADKAAVAVTGTWASKRSDPVWAAVVTSPLQGAAVSNGAG